MLCISNEIGIADGDRARNLSPFNTDITITIFLVSRLRREFNRRVSGKVKPANSLVSRNIAKSREPRSNHDDHVDHASTAAEPVKDEWSERVPDSLIDRDERLS